MKVGRAVLVSPDRKEPGGRADDHRGLKQAAQTFTRDVAMLSCCAA